MDLCEKTSESEVKVLHINLYCSCHLRRIWWSCTGLRSDGGQISQGSINCNCRQHKISEMRSWERGYQEGKVVELCLVVAFQIN